MQTRTNAVTAMIERVHDSVPPWMTTMHSDRYYHLSWMTCEVGLESKYTSLTWQSVYNYSIHTTTYNMYTPFLFSRCTLPEFIQVKFGQLPLRVLTALDWIEQSLTPHRTVQKKCTVQYSAQHMSRFVRRRGPTSKYHPTQDDSGATWSRLGQWLAPWLGMRERDGKPLVIQDRHSSSRHALLIA